MKPNSSSFYERAYELVRVIPQGRIITYGHVALVLGSPAAARAVGYALHHLPPSSDVPWWRVVNAHGRISLRGRGAAADRQRALLQGEGVQFDSDDRIDLDRYSWLPEMREVPGVAKQS